MRKEVLASIKAECANWRSGACLGTDARTTFTVPLPVCLIQIDMPCSYFESCVLPTVRRRPGGVNLELDYAKATAAPLPVGVDAIQEESLRDRVMVHPFCGHSSGWMKKGIGEMRQCGCGKALVRRQRVCPDCHLKRRREAARRGMKARRQETGSGVNS